MSNKNRIMFIFIGMLFLLCPNLLGVRSANADSIVGPASWTECKVINGNSYYYSLGLSELAVVLPGDQISFKGNGIKGGRIEGDATKKEYGGWKVLSSGDGDVAFEATNNAEFHGQATISSFILQAKENTTTGQIKSKITGDFIGNSNNVDGPVIK